MLANILANLLNLANQRQAIDLSDIEGKSIGIDISESPQTIGLKVLNNKFYAIDYSEVDVTLSGDLRAFLAMLKDADALESDELMISGKLQAAKRYQKVFAELRFDWEKFLGGFIPPELVEKASEQVRLSLDIAKQMGNDLLVGFSDYASDKEWVVSEAEYAKFSGKLQTTLNKVEQLINEIKAKQ